MNLRKLRFAFSATSGIVSILLVALWIRSCTWVDAVNGQVTGKYAVGIGSLPGSIAAYIYPNEEHPSLPRWTLTSVETDRWLKSTRGGVPHPTRLWGAFHAERFMIVVPYWFATIVLLVSAALSLVPWIHWQFSLRSLLIATTLLALVMGCVVYLLGK
jgi:hypothetical protein